MAVIERVKERREGREVYQRHLLGCDNAMYGGRGDGGKDQSKCDVEV